MRVPQLTLDDYEQTFSDRHLLQGVVAKWAKAKPDAPCLVERGDGRTVTWCEFDRITAALAGELLRLGFAKGDFLVTLLPMSVDHVLLEYSCFKIGVIVAPLDLRLPPAEVMRALEILRPRGFVRPGREERHSIFARCGAPCRRSAHGSSIASRWTRTVRLTARGLLRRLPKRRLNCFEIGSDDDSTVTENDGALVIFTTGSTGSPKPALLSHRNITAQNMCICGDVFWRRQRLAHPGQSACFARGRPDRGADEHPLRRRHGDPAGDFRRRPFVARHCPASGGDSGPDSGHVQPGVDAERLRSPRSLESEICRLRRQCGRAAVS